VGRAQVQWTARQMNMGLSVRFVWLGPMATWCDRRKKKRKTQVQVKVCSI